MVQLTSSFLSRHRRIGLDSNVLIFLIERNSDFARSIDDIFLGVNRQQFWLSIVAIPEVLIKPIVGDRKALVEKYKEMLGEVDFLFAELTVSTGYLAAELGGRYNLGSRDALHIACLLENGVTGFITADKSLERIKELEVCILKPNV